MVNYNSNSGWYKVETNFLKKGKSRKGKSKRLNPLEGMPGRKFLDDAVYLFLEKGDAIDLLDRFRSRDGLYGDMIPNTIRLSHGEAHILEEDLFKAGYNLEEAKKGLVRYDFSKKACVF